MSVRALECDLPPIRVRLSRAREAIHGERVDDVLWLRRHLGRWVSERGALGAARLRAFLVGVDEGGGSWGGLDAAITAVVSGRVVATREPLRRVVRASGEERPASPVAPLQPTSDDVSAWIEVRLVDEIGQPVPGARYRIKLPDGTTRSGYLDAHGLVHLRGIDPGECEFTFPDLDTESWERV